MIERFVVKHLDKIYSTPIGNYTCEDIEYWGLTKNKTMV